MSEFAKAWRAEQLQVDAKYDGAEATIIVEGELDIHSVERFLACVSEALEAHPGSISVDARGVTFMDSSGLAAVLHARSMSGHAGVPFRISDPSPQVRRAVEVAGVEELLTDR